MSKPSTTISIAAGAAAGGCETLVTVIQNIQQLPQESISLTTYYSTPSNTSKPAANCPAPKTSPQYQ
jgi:hypothetical protein